MEFENNSVGEEKTSVSDRKYTDDISLYSKIPILICSIMALYFAAKGAIHEMNVDSQAFSQFVKRSSLELVTGIKSGEKYLSGKVSDGIFSSPVENRKDVILRKSSLESLDVKLKEGATAGAEALKALDNDYFRNSEQNP